MAFEKFVDETVYTPEHSLSGNNGYYYRCEVLGQEVNFAVCCSKMGLHAKNDLPKMYADCGRAIDQDTCRAVGMREQEILQGKAIYFLNRSKQIEFYSGSPKQDSVKQAASRPATSWGTTRYAPTPAPAAAPQRVVVAKPAAVEEEGGFAAAINDAIANAQPASLLDRAREMAKGKT